MAELKKNEAEISTRAFPLESPSNNLPQCFTAMISAKLLRHVSSVVFHNMYSKRFRNCTVVAWCEQHGDPSIVLTECERKDCFEQITKRQFFCLPQEKVHFAVAQDCVFGRHLILLTWSFSGRCINSRQVCIESLIFVGWGRNDDFSAVFSSFRFSKQKLVTRVFYLCFAAKEEFC